MTRPIESTAAFQNRSLSSNGRSANLAKVVVVSREGPLEAESMVCKDRTETRVLGLRLFFERASSRASWYEGIN